MLDSRLCNSKNDVHSTIRNCSNYKMADTFYLFGFDTIIDEVGEDVDIK
ncbi:MAG TPA: hypothetical protein VD815_06860 [Candidatus Saccharimonadales bacterium]|nr:hypothetical protein [Candidatus Saccharimonadales bacterium]